MRRRGPSYIYTRNSALARGHCATDLEGSVNREQSRSLQPGRPATMTTKMIELESQEAVETMRAATVAHVGASAALRLLASAASLAAALVVVTNSQDRWGVTVTFKMLDVWVAFVAMNFFCCAYALLTAIFVKRFISTCWLHHSDLFMVNMQTAATAGAGAVGTVAMWGNEPSGWFAVCRLYRLYCDKGVISLALAFTAFAALGVGASLSRYPRAPPPDTRK